MITILSRSYRCVATDGIYLHPLCVYGHAMKTIRQKVENDVSVFIRRCNDPVVADIPRFKIYSILNYPNKFFGQRFSPQYTLINSIAFYAGNAEYTACAMYL